MNDRKISDEEMSPGARAFIDEVRELDGPSAGDRDRIKKALVATIASGAGLAATTVGSGTAAAGTIATGTIATGTTAAGTLSLGVKIAVVAMVAAAVGGTALVVTQPEQETAPVAREVAATFVEPEPLRTEPIALELTPSSAEGVEEPLEVVESPEAAPDELVVAPISAVAEAAPRRVRRVATRREIAVADSTLTEEIVLIRRAQRALQAGDTEAALRHLGDHASRFTTGVLAEEREAAQVVALCQAGRAADSRALAQRFVRERPSSPHRARVLNACPEN